MALLEFTPKGIYCPRADIYIDPWRKVDKALITHGHSDHARGGHTSYLCSETSVPVLKHRLGKIQVESLPYGKKRMINGVRFSFHPAGHVIGSAQIRVAYKGEVWVASGDYKIEDDGFSEKFEPVPCHTFITESTFALPVYQWRPQVEIIAQINQWWKLNRSDKKISVLGAYSLGKAQRIIANVDLNIGKIYCDHAVSSMNDALRSYGIKLPPTKKLLPDMDIRDLEGALVIGAPSSNNSQWMRDFNKVTTASASGWNQLRKRRLTGSQNMGFVLSDHADWNGLMDAISATGAERVYVTHGYTSVFTRWLKQEGYDARIVQTKFGEEDTLN